MSAEDISEVVVKPMRALWEPPHGKNIEEQKTALGEYVAALAGFSRAELMEAWRVVRESHDKASWPKPATLVKAALKARQVIAQAASRAVPRADRNERWRHWLFVRRQPIAQEAVEYGWAWSLKHDILDGIPLEAIDPDAMRAARDRAAALHEQVANEPRWAGRELILTSWDRLCAREDETAREIAAATDSESALAQLPDRARGVNASIVRFCSRRGMSERETQVLLRPSDWWRTPQAEWPPVWRIEDVPRAYRESGMLR